tara:strand:- start:379 stop:576 length:198 start_codon:yes stop_codon:yes gene_type:complete
MVVEDRKVVEVVAQKEKKVSQQYLEVGWLAGRIPNKMVDLVELETRMQSVGDQKVTALVVADHVR